MSKRLILHKFAVLALALTAGLPVWQAQTIPVRKGDGAHSAPIRISSYEDDPFVSESTVKQMDPARFGLSKDGRRILMGAQVQLSEESKVYRRDTKTNEFAPFAWNPWPALPLANEQGDFRFPNEKRFPFLQIERDPEGKPTLRDGLQVWLPQDLRLGMTTAFHAAHAAKDAAESWAGREIVWGVNGLLDIEPHAFIDFNAFYSPSARSLFFGVVPYRFPGQTDVKIFETATSWEMVVHECGHALHHVLKPNIDVSYRNLGYGPWTESLADQTAMWAQLRYLDRVVKLLAETNGDLNQSNFLTRMTEAFAALVGKGTGIRDAFHDKKVSDTDEEVHDRSQVLTGAAYQFFLTVYEGLRRQLKAEEALLQAGQIMGFFLMRSTDYVPENQLTLEDVAKAYLKVDKEFFDGRYHNVLVNEFVRRELFDAGSEHEWLTHEASIPALWRPWWLADESLESLIEYSQDKLGIGPDFGLKLQSITHTSGPAQTLVRVQLTQGRGAGATPLNNHGILVFRANGTLADYHPPLMPDADTPFLMETRAKSLLGKARQLRLEQHGVPLSLVRRPDGQMTVEARVLRGEGLNQYVEVFTPENPRGERREVVIPPIPRGQQLRIAEDLLR
ncbi:MAG: hypothetical protein HY820_23100 [Acidobacteria bacterium]|nr:hypothetical protein [Acidobacteriota bacterium]